MLLRSWFSAFPSEKQASAKIYLPFRQLGSRDDLGVKKRGVWSMQRDGRQDLALPPVPKRNKDMDSASTSKWIVENWSWPRLRRRFVVHGFFSSVVMLFEPGESSAWCLHEFRYAAWCLNEVVTRQQATAWTKASTWSVRKDCKVGGCGNAYSDVTLGSDVVLWRC